MQPPLTPQDHNRQIEGMTYVYPVMSRRAGGLSIGINFNPNNACNWRCIYCQVPDLQRGSAPDINFTQLADELQRFLDYVLNGSFYSDFQVQPAHRQIKDIAISGNGESTSVREFARAIQLIGEIATTHGLFPSCRFILISNGSLIHHTATQQGLKTLHQFNGELWFKIDSATAAGRKLINNCVLSDRQLLDNLTVATGLCTTRIQTCMLHYQEAWSEQEQQAYLDLLSQIKQRQLAIAEILLYSVARQSFQPEAGQLKSVDIDTLNAFADRIRAIGYSVKVTP